MRDRRFSSGAIGKVSILVAAIAGAGTGCGGYTNERPITDATVSAPLSVNGGTYQGCFTDDRSRALPVALMGGGATVETCLDAARAQGYRYAGLQYYGNCFAGDTLEYSLVDDSQCNTACSANPAEMCGGEWHNSVWSTAIINPGDDPAPGDVFRLSAGAGEGNIALNWLNPGDPDFAGVLVVRSSDVQCVPVDFVPRNGIAYVVGTTVGDSGAVVGYVGSSPSALLSELINGQQYYLKVFAFDANHNYSSGLQATATIPVPSGTYLGCYTDGNVRALPVALMGGATLETCLDAARAQGYSYAGLQYYGQCFAGDTLGYSLDDDSKCNTRCSANPAEMCGGAWHNSVWSTGSPGAYAGPDQLIECPATQQVDVTLHGWGSSDPSAYLWTWTDGTNTQTATGPSPTITFPFWGIYDIALQVTDSVGLVSTGSVRITVGDTLAPRTTASVVGTKRDGVYTSKVDVTLTSKDSCTGVKEIHYTINGAETMVPVVPATQEASTTFSLEYTGTYAITFWAVDNAGRSSSPVYITPLTVNPGGGSGGGFYSSCVDVSLYSDGSGQLFYTLDGTTYQPVTGSIPVCQETSNTLIYGYTVPSANIEPVQTLVITIDRSPPSITITGLENGATYSLGFVPTAGYTVSDTGSGVALSSASLSGGDGYGLGVFTYTVTATDNLGQTAALSATYTVIATIPGLKQLVLQYRASGAIADQGLTDTLLSILATAQNATTPNDQDGYLQDFKNQVLAQSGKKISAQAVGVLANAAIYVMNHN